MEPLIVTVAAVGAEITRQQQPNLPLTPDELARDAVACVEAGASIYHLHVRDEAGHPTMDIETYRRAHDAIRSACDVIVQFSSGGSVTDGEQERIAPLQLQPEMASLTPGTVNFGDEVFSNPRPLVRRFYARMRELKILPEFEIFEPGMIATAMDVYEEIGDDHHAHFDFVLGVPGAMPAWPDVLGWLVAKLPKGATWSATGIGRSNFVVAAAAISNGGHVRTGFEDVLYVSKGVLAASNRQLVERIADLAQASGREIASPRIARQLLGL